MFGPGEVVSVVLSEVNCTGGEDRLSDCPSAGFHQQSSVCESSSGVICSKKMPQTLETLFMVVIIPLLVKLLESILLWLCMYFMACELNALNSCFCNEGYIVNRCVDDEDMPPFTQSNTNK